VTLGHYLKYYQEDDKRKYSKTLARILYQYISTFLAKQEKECSERTTTFEWTEEWIYFLMILKLYLGACDTIDAKFAGETLTNLLEGKVVDPDLFQFKSNTKLFRKLPHGMYTINHNR
jgi:hypothetical protein